MLEKIGGDSPLTEAGRAYAKCLNTFIQKYDKDHQKSSDTQKSFEQLMDSQTSLLQPKIRVFTSTLTRAKQTAEAFDSEYFEVACIRYFICLNF